MYACINYYCVYVYIVREGYEMNVDFTYDQNPITITNMCQVALMMRSVGRIFYKRGM